MITSERVEELSDIRPFGSTMWLRNHWYVAAWAHDVGAELTARTILDEPVIVYRLPDGDVVALEDRCAHRSLPLSMGCLVGEVVQCGYHGLRYDRNGRCVSIPGQDSIPNRARVKVFPTVERDRLVWIWMGDPERADPAAVPDMHWLVDRRWTCSIGYHHIAANYRLLNDNLLDLSHESFVHVETIGSRAVAESPVKAEIIDDREVRVSRFMADCDPPPFYVKASGFTERIDRWHTTIFHPPSTLVIENGSKPAGATDPATFAERRVINLITPETASSSHYFWAIARAYELDDPGLTEYIRSNVVSTFDQDKAVLEAQQRVIAANPDDGFPISIKTDAGPILARRLLDRTLEREHRANALPIR